MEKQLQSLEDFNNQRHEIYTKLRFMANGIACPECGHELIDGDKIYFTSPGKREIKCTNCTYTGTRIA